VLSFCRALGDAGLHVSWGASCRIDRLDPELLEVMAEAGCDSLFFGLESSSPQLQIAIGKVLPEEIIQRTLKHVARLGMKPCLSHIVGFPEETKAEINLTIRKATQYRYQYPMEQWTQLHALAPLTGSPLYHEYHDRLEFDGLYSDFALDILSEEDLVWIKKYPDMFSVYYHYPLRHWNNKEVSRTVYLFTVLFGMRYTCFWLWQDKAFRYPEGLIERIPMAELPRQLTKDQVQPADIEAVIRFVKDTFPEVAAERHPLIDIMRYDHTLLRCRLHGPQMETFTWDVHRFAKDASADDFRSLPSISPGNFSLLFHLRGEDVQVRRLADSFAFGLHG
jgi:hypothetical protein